MAAHKPVYLDYAAATPMDPDVLAAMQPYFKEQFYNPSAQYLASKRVRAAVDQARSEVAKVLGAKPAEIFFTAGGTEANNLAIHGVMRQFELPIIETEVSRPNIVVSAIEHESVLKTAKHYSTRVIPVQPDGRIDLKTLERAIDENTVMVSVMYANNEIGTIEPIREIAEIIKQKRHERLQAKLDAKQPATIRGVEISGNLNIASPNLLPLYFHTDACQAANYLPLQVARLGVDLMTLNGGKIYGPKQSGTLYVKSGVFLKPLIDGGGQESDLRSGTENVPAIIGFATALVKAQSMRTEESKRLQAIQKQAFDLIESKLPTTIINGSRKHRLPNNINLSIPGVDAERLVMELDEHGIQTATGSACSAAKQAPSHVLMAIGLPEDICRSSLRLTMGRSTTSNEIELVIKALLS